MKIMNEIHDLRIGKTTLYRLLDAIKLENRDEANHPWNFLYYIISQPSLSSTKRTYGFVVSIM